MPDSELSPDAATAYRTPEDTPTVVPDSGRGRAQILQLTPGTVLGGRYRIVSMVGRGGMGVVYRADDLKLGQTIALKFVLRRGGDEHRLYEEVRIGREVSHPNVVRLHDIAEVEGDLFITMEFVGGEDLASLIRRIGRLSTDKAVALARDICSGLAAAHEKGVVHRDLKPGNVLIDGRGRARITDFGLAVAEEGVAHQISAGTPAYMAPEQLSGEPASVRSDIYALGLVLYEIFTGKPAFDAPTTIELMRRQSSSDFVRPTAIARDIDPIVERIILRCLDPEPSRRPASVEEMLQALPARDALSAAVAAGETPSPEMVAAASERGDLPIGAAASLLVFLILALAGYALLTSRTMLYRRLPVLKSPEVLEEKAREIIAATGHSGVRADNASLFYVDPDEPTSMLFRYRQSPRPLVTHTGQRFVTTTDPPLTESGMADVTLDASGRLVELAIVPPQVRQNETQTRAVDWSTFLGSTGVSGQLKPATPRWAAPVDSDHKQAWTAGNARIEAASYAGLPVWFAVIQPWTRADRMDSPRPATAATRTAEATFVFLAIGMPMVIILLALRNLRRGRIDRRGVFRFAAFIFLAVFSAALFRAHHVRAFIPEWLMITRLVVDSAFWSGISGLAYVAIEPLVRRRWPRMLIGWSRLLEGRLNDPLVGREMLVGMSAGVIIIIVWQLTALVPGAPPLQMTTTPLSGLRHVAFFLLWGLVEAALRTIGTVTLLLIIHALARNIRVTLAVGWLIGSASLLGDATGPFVARAAYAAVAGALVLVVTYRFGLLALATAAYTVLVLRNLPITIDPSAWYFGRSALALALLLGLAIYGTIVSLGGKRWMPDFDFD
jgi:hypothetical protein